MHLKHIIGWLHKPQTIAIGAAREGSIQPQEGHSELLLLL